jgi:glutamate-ammonia-ligase adenylyltransferase
MPRPSRSAAAPFHLPAVWPPPADPPAGERLLQGFAELGRAEAGLARRGPVAAMLRCLGGNAPYLADLALREAASLRRLVRDGPDAVVAAAMAELAALPPGSPRPRVAALLRQAKRRVALVVAVADIGGVWTLEQVTASLSALAEATLGLAVAHLLRSAHDAGELVLPHPETPARECGFTVLGMGKLGAGELNYSSDVDLILLHDPAAGVYPGDQPRAFYTRMARNLVTLMEARDADGYVFRTDLRLRPDPAATAPCISLPGAISYYESMGQNWERAAMLKARPVAGDLALGQVFLEAIRPFIWRRHLDFVALGDIQAMKQRIDAHKGTGARRQGDAVARVLGLNVKLGEGGIREIEFLAQSLQLVWGGRDPALRSPRTLEALRALARGGHLPAGKVPGLVATYRFLRRVEHRLQMINDRQTHSLPEQAGQLDGFAMFLGFADAASFARTLRGHQRRVASAYAAAFAGIPEREGAAQGLDFRGIGEPPPRTLEALTGMGYGNPGAIVAAARSWQAGRVRALRSERSQALMMQVLPPLLQALARQPQPDAAFARFDELLARLPAGVQLLSLFQRNPLLLDRIAAVLGASPSLADHLARSPSALEGLLAPVAAPDYARVLRAQLGDARTLEDSIAIIRAAVREEEFALSVATMEGRLDADAAGVARAGLADAALASLLGPVLEDFASRFGRVRGGGLALVVMGKAGGREMMAGSDLDLMLIYDHAGSAIESSGKGKKHLASSQWFIRAVHAFIAAITVPDAEGPMFAVDMRLRPSGNKGPVAVSLAAFERYHAPPPELPANTPPGAAHSHGQGAWTWERMALTRARVIAGPARLRARVEAAIRTALAHAGPPAQLRADAAAMRARLLRELPPAGPWDVKARAGGQIEVEFIAQTLQLAHGREHPELFHPTTREALRRLRDAGLLPEADAATLIRADHAWRTVQGMLRITYGRGRMDRLAQSTASALLRAAAEAGLPAVDVAALRATLDAIALQVRACFNRHVGEIVS